MFPHIDANLFGLELHFNTANFLFALYTLVAICAFSLSFKRERVAVRAAIVATLVAASSFLGARLFHLLVEKPVSQFSIEQLLRFDGMTFYGALLGGAASLVIGTLLLLKRSRFAQSFDIAAIIVAFGYGVLRIGCFATGCCWGKLTALPWAVRYFESPVMPALGLPVHPVQLYDSALGFLLGAALIYLRSRKLAAPGQLFPIFVIAYSIGRIITEIFRGDGFRGENVFLFFSTSQTISLALIFLTVIAMAIGNSRRAREIL